MLEEETPGGAGGSSTHLATGEAGLACSSSARSPEPASPDPTRPSPTAPHRAAPEPLLSPAPSSAPEPLLLPAPCQPPEPLLPPGPSEPARSLEKAAVGRGVAPCMATGEAQRPAGEAHLEPCTTLAASLVVMLAIVLVRGFPDTCGVSGS